MKLFFKLLGRVVVIVLLLSIGLTIYSLASDKESNTTTIIDNYALVKESSRSVYIIRDNGNKNTANSTTTIVESIIISYATDGDYIAAKQTAVPDSEEVKPDFTSFSYWLIDTAQDRIYGPFNNDADWGEKCTELGLNFDEWLGT
jgi:hypothetical protein